MVKFSSEATLFFKTFSLEFAYGPLEHSRRDLAAVIIQRGRDHGLPDYNTARMAFNLQPVTSFRAINNDTSVVPSKVAYENIIIKSITAYQNP